MVSRSLGLTNWRVVLRLGRVSNLPTVWSNALAGVVLAGAAPGDGRLPLLLTAFSLLYLAGMFLNDAFDRDFDARIRAERPIPQGEIGAAAVFGAGFAMLAAGVLLVASTGKSALIAGLALAAAIVAYDLYHKGNPLGPIVMALCRALVYVTAALAISRAVPLPVALGALSLFAYLVGLTYVAKQETLASPAALWPLLVLAVPFAYGLACVAASLLALPFYLGFLFWTVRAMRFLLPGRRDVRRSVVALIVGISLLDAVLMAGAGSLSGALAGVAAFLLATVLQRHVAGT